MKLKRWLTFGLQVCVGAIPAVLAIAPSSDAVFPRQFTPTQYTGYYVPPSSYRSYPITFSFTPSNKGDSKQRGAKRQDVQGTFSDSYLEITAEGDGVYNTKNGTLRMIWTISSVPGSENTCNREKFRTRYQVRQLENNPDRQKIKLQYKVLRCNGQAGSDVQVDPSVPESEVTLLPASE
ncbi:MAG: hypothetical protein AAGG02_02970 [Cyanobacteria bacterium P01_H01_bin.15]